VFRAHECIDIGGSIQAAERSRWGAAVSCAENYDKGKNVIGTSQTSCRHRIAAWRMLAGAVRGETARHEVEARCAAGNARQHECTKHAADHLRDDVQCDVASGKAAGNCQADADRRVQMASADMSDRISQGEAVKPNAGATPEKSMPK